MTNEGNRDRGYFHLTPHGWVRQDSQPFPDDRVETWMYEMERPAEDAKERIFLTRTWIHPDVNAEGRESLRTRYAQPLMATPDRNVTLECLV